MLDVATTTVSTAPVFAMSALALTMIIASVYFTIFYMIWVVIGWGLARVFRPIVLLLRAGDRFYD